MMSEYLKNATAVLLLFVSSNFLRCQIYKGNDLENLSLMITGESLKGYSGSGTGFIIRYIDKYFLVTNYHVLTGRDPANDGLVPGITDTNIAVDVEFRSKLGPNVFYPERYPLFNEHRARNFGFYKYGNFLVDVAVLCVIYPKDALNSTIPFDQIDTSVVFPPKTKIYILGFANGLFIDQWKPRRIVSYILQPTFTDPESFNPFLYIDSPTYKGMSGSPVYKISGQGLPSLCALAVSTTQPGFTDAFRKMNPDFQSLVVQIKFAALLIENMYKLNAPAVSGEVLPSK